MGFAQKTSFLPKKAHFLIESSRFVGLSRNSCTRLARPLWFQNRKMGAGIGCASFTDIAAFRKRTRCCQNPQSLHAKVAATPKWSSQVSTIWCLRHRESVCPRKVVLWDIAPRNYSRAAFATFTLPREGCIESAIALAPPYPALFIWWKQACGGATLKTLLGICIKLNNTNVFSQWGSIIKYFEREFPEVRQKINMHVISVEHNM